MKKNILILILGVFLIVLPFTKVYSQGLSEYCLAGNICQIIYIPASFNILDSNLGQAQETETRLVVQNTDGYGRSILLKYVALLGPNTEVVKEYVGPGTTGSMQVTAFSSVSFLTPNSDSGIAKFSENDGRPKFIVVVNIPIEDPPVTSPIIEAERSIINLNRAGSYSVQSVDITNGTILQEIISLTP